MNSAVYDISIRKEEKRRKKGRRGFFFKKGNGNKTLDRRRRRRREEGKKAQAPSRVKGGNYMSEGKGREGKLAEPEKSVVPPVSV